VSDLAELFPAADYRFHLTLRRGEPADFFRPQDASSRLLRERAKWIEADPACCVALTPEGGLLLEEFAALAAAWQVPGADKLSDVAELGRRLEPDILFLSPDAAGEFRLRGGALCFPTGWALQEKIGQPLDFIHGVVPGLNATLGVSIQQFLAKLKPGWAFLRDNWGIAATDELNLHPARAFPAPALPVALDRLWLRVEHQALMALPRSGGVVFGIRIALHRLDEVARNPAAAVGLKRALASMPAELAAYKRLDAIRSELAALL
jgi:hypothetical protein